MHVSSRGGTSGGLTCNTNIRQGGCTTSAPVPSGCGPSATCAPNIGTGFPNCPGGGPAASFYTVVVSTAWYKCASTTDPNWQSQYCNEKPYICATYTLYTSGACTPFVNCMGTWQDVTWACASNLGGDTSSNGNNGCPGQNSNPVYTPPTQAL